MTKDLWPNRFVHNLASRKRGAFKHASRNLATTLDKLHHRRAQKMRGFLETRARVGAILKLPLINRRITFETIRSVVEYRLLRRNHLQTLYHVSLSSLHQHRPSETKTFRLAPKTPSSEIISLRLETELDDLPPRNLSAKTSMPKPSPAPSVRNHLSSHLFLDHRPWLIPPWVSNILSAPPPWLVPPVPNEAASRPSLASRPLQPVCTHPSFRMFLRQQSWLIPPWVCKILSAPPPWLVPPVPNETVAGPNLIFLKLQPWIIPPWICLLLMRLVVG